jgi:hypothetical protein
VAEQHADGGVTGPSLRRRGHARARASSPRRGTALRTSVALSTSRDKNRTSDSRIGKSPPKQQVAGRNGRRTDASLGLGEERLLGRHAESAVHREPHPPAHGDAIPGAAAVQVGLSLSLVDSTDSTLLDGCMETSYPSLSYPAREVVWGRGGGGEGAPQRYLRDTALGQRCDRVVEHVLCARMAGVQGATGRQSRLSLTLLAGHVRTGRGRWLGAVAALAWHRRGSRRKESGSCQPPPS